MKRHLVFLLLVFLAGCVNNQRTFSKITTNVKPVGVPNVGSFEETFEYYLVSDIDESYYVGSFPSDNKTYTKLIGTATNLSVETISGRTVQFAYNGVVDDEPVVMIYYFGNNVYTIGTDAPVSKKAVMIDLFKYYFDLK